MTFRISITAAFTLTLLALTGCRQEAPVRHYTEVVPPPPAVKPPVPAQPGSPAVAPPPAPAADLGWTAPQGWSEQAGSGMRLATFSLVGGERSGECTIVTLGGQAGGAAANLKRWIGQLPDAEVDDQGLDDFVAGLDTFTTVGGHSGTFADLGTFVPDHHDHTSMLAGIITRGEQTVFVKLMGPKSLLKENTEAFLQLCKSIR